MSYIKNVKITDFKIIGLNGKTATIGDGVVSIMQFDYFESIFEPAVSASVVLVCDQKIVSELPIRGSERVEITVVHDSGSVEFTDWVVRGMSEPSTSSTQCVVQLSLTTPENIKQEFKSNRLFQRYDPKVPISTHVTNILKTFTDKPTDIEKTANSYGFFGNYWRPFKAIYWLARRSMATGGGDRAGFLFWETKSGYNFKSIDTIAAGAKNSVVQSFSQREYVSENDDADNYKVLAPFMEYNQDIIYKMRKGGYGDNTKFFNPYTLPQTFQPEDNHKYSESFEKVDSFGTEDFVRMAYNIEDNPTVVDVQPFVSGTMTQDGSVDPESDSGNPHKWMSQSNIKYQQILSQSLRVTVPMNLELEAGVPINLNLISPNNGLDNHESGVYLIKDLRHTIKFGEKGVECFTNLRCIRDNYGNDGINTNVTLLNS